MSVISVILRQLAKNADDIGELIIKHGDVLESAIRSGDPDAFLRNVDNLDGAAASAFRGNRMFMTALSKASKNLDYLDNLGRAGAKIDADDIIRRLDIDPASAAARGLRSSGAALREAAEQTAETLGRASDDINDARRKLNAAADAAPRSGADSVLARVGGMEQRLINRKLKWGLRGTLLGVGAIGFEFATGGAMSTGAANLTVALGEKIKEWNPELGDKIIQAGMDAGEFVLDVADTVTQAKVNFAATLAENAGEYEMATGIRMGYLVTGGAPGLLVRLGRTDSADRPEQLAEILCDELKIDRTQLEQYLKRHPNQLAALETVTSIDLASVYPEMVAQRDTEAVERRAAELLTAGLDLKNLSAPSMSSVFNHAAENSGFMGGVWKFFAGIASIFGENAEKFVQGLAMSTFDAQVKANALQHAASQNLLVAANGDQVGIEDLRPAPVPVAQPAPT